MAFTKDEVLTLIQTAMSGGGRGKFTLETSELEESYKKMQQTAEQTADVFLEIQKELASQNLGLSVEDNKHGGFNLVVGFNGKADDLLLSFDQQDFLGNISNNNQQSTNKKILGLERDSKGNIIPAAQISTVFEHRIRGLQNLLRQTNGIVSDAKKFRRRIKAVDREIRQLDSAVGLNRNYNDAMKKEQGGFDLKNGLGNVSLQRLQYNAVKGQQMSYDPLINDLILKYQRAARQLAQASHNKNKQRAEAQMQEDLNMLIATTQAMDYSREQIINHMKKNEQYSYFSADERKEVAAILETVRKIGIGFGAGSEQGYAKHVSTKVKAKDILPFGGLVVGENRSWVQGFDISNRATQKSGVTKPRKYASTNGGVIYSNKQNELIDLYQRDGKKIDHSYESLYRTIAVSQGKLNSAIKGAKEYIKNNNYSQKQQKQYLKILQNMDLLGVREGGMMLSGNVIEDLERSIEKEATIYQDDINALLKEGGSVRSNGKTFTNTKFQAFKKQYGQLGFDDETLAAIMLSHKLGNNILTDAKLTTKEDGSRLIKMAFNTSGQEAHRYLYGQGTRTAASFYGKHHKAKDVDFVTRLIASQITGLDINDASLGKVVGFTEMGSLKERKIGDTMGNILNDLFYSVSKTGGNTKFVDELNKKLPKELQGIIEVTNNGKLQYNISNERNNYLTSGKAWHNFLGSVIQAAHASGVKDDQLPFKVTDEGVNFTKDYYFQSGSLNAGDQDVYGNAFNKNGRWLSIDRKTLESIQHTTGRNSDTSQAMEQLFNKSLRTSTEQYNRTKQNIQRSTSLMANQEEFKNGSTVVVSMEELTQKREEFLKLQEDLESRGETRFVDGKMRKDLYDVSPYGFMMNKLAEEADRRGVQIDELDVAIDLGKKMDLYNQYEDKYLQTQYIPFLSHLQYDVEKGQATQKLGSTVSRQLGNNKIALVKKYDAEQYKAFDNFVRNFGESNTDRDDYTLSEYFGSSLDYFFGDSSYTEGARKGRLGHAAALTATAPNMLAKGASGNRASEWLEKKHGMILNSETLKGMLTYQGVGDKAEYDNALKELYTAFYGEEPKNKEGHQLTNKTMIKRIVAGTNVKNDSIDKEELFRRGNLLNMMFGRFPYIYGEDVHLGSVLTSSDVDANKFWVSMATHRMMNEDFDADKNMMSLLNFSLPQNSKELEAWKKRTTEQAAWTKAFLEAKGGALVGDEYGNKQAGDSLYTIENISTLGDEEKDRLAEIVSRTNRKFIGMFSNFSQSVRSGQLLSGLDRANGAINPEAMLRSDITRELFAAIEQDAISAKKIRESKSSTGTEKENALQHISRLEKIWNLMQDSNTWTKGTKELTKKGGLLDLLQEAGIIQGKTSSIFSQNKRLGVLTSNLMEYDANTIANVLGINKKDTEKMGRINTFLGLKNNKKAAAEFIQNNGSLFGMESLLGTEGGRELLAKILVDSNSDIAGVDTFKAPDGTTISASNFAELYNNRNRIKGISHINALNYGYYLEKVMKNGANPRERSVVDNAWKTENELNQLLLNGGISLGGAIDGRSGEDPRTVYQKTHKRALDNKSLYGDAKYVSSVTGLVGKMMPYGQPGIENSEFWNMINSDPESLKKLEENNYLGYGSQIEFNNAFKKEKISASGTARHSLTQMLLQANKLGLGLESWEDISALYDKYESNPQDITSNQKKFIKWATEKDKEHNNSSFYGNVANYLAALQQTSTPTAAARESLSLLESADRYRNVIENNSDGLLGVEQQVAGFWGGGSSGNGQWIQGVVDVLRKREGVDHFGEKRNYLDVLDIKPGEFNLKQLLQVSMYKEFLDQWRTKAFGLAGTGKDGSISVSAFKKDKNAQDLLQQMGGDISSDLFKTLMAKDKDGNWKYTLRAGVVNDGKNETYLGFDTDPGNKLFNQNIQTLLGAASSAMSLGGTGVLTDYLSSDQMKQILSSGSYNRSGVAGDSEVNLLSLRTQYLEKSKEILKIEREINQLKLEQTLTEKDNTEAIKTQTDALEKAKQTRDALGISRQDVEKDEAAKLLLENMENEGAEGIKNANKVALNRKYKQILSERRGLNDQLENAAMSNQLRARDGKVSAEEQAMYNLQIEDLETALQEKDAEIEQFLANAKDKYGLEGADFQKTRENHELRERITQNAREVKLARASQAPAGKTGPGLFDRIGGQFQNALFMRFFSGQALFSKLAKGIQTVINQAKALNKTLVNLQVVTGKTTSETQSMISSYSRLGTQLGATTQEVASAANDWLRQGYSVAETNDLITASLHLSKLGMIDSATATTRLTSAMKGFHLEAGEAMSVVDKLVTVDMKAAASAGDIAEALSQFATTAQLSGLDMDQSIAMATTVMDVSQAGASSVGAAFKTILSRYGNVKAGSFTSMEGDEDGGKSINDIEKVLSKIGIRLRSATYEIRDFDEVLEEVSDKWGSLDNVTQNALATAFAGTRQRESFLVLMENMDKYHELLEESKNSAGTAEKKYQSYSDQLEASEKRLQAAWEELANNADIQRFLKQITDFTTKLVKVLPTIIKWFTRLAGQWVAGRSTKIIGKLASASGATRLVGGLRASAQSGGVAGLMGRWSFGAGNTAQNGVFKYTQENTNALRELTRAIRGQSPIKGQSATVAGANAVGNLPRLGLQVTRGEDGKITGGTYTKLGAKGFFFGRKKATTTSLNYVNGQWEGEQAARANRAWKKDMNNPKYFEQQEKLFMAGKTGNRLTFNRRYGQYMQRAQAQYGAPLKEDINSGYTIGNGKTTWSRSVENGKEVWTSAGGQKLTNPEGAKYKELQAQYNNQVRMKDATKASQKMNKFASGAMAGIDAAARVTTGAILGYETASKTGTGKDRNGNEITFDLDEAEIGNQQVIGTFGGIASAIPIIGPLLQLGFDHWAKNTDGVKEARRKAEFHANAVLDQQVLSSIESSTNSLGQLGSKFDWSEEDRSQFIQQRDKVLDTLNTKENRETRTLYTSYLKDVLKNQGVQIDGSADLYDITEQMNGNIEDQKKLALAMGVAEKKAEKDALLREQAQDREKLNTETGTAIAKAQKAIYEKRIEDAGLLGGVGGFFEGALAGAGAGAAAGALAGAGIGAAAAGVGAAPGAGIGALVGAIGGFLGGGFTAMNARKKQKEEQEKIKLAEENRLAAATYSEKIEEFEKERQSALEKDDYDVARDFEQAIQALKDIRAETKSMNKKVDKIAVEEAVLAATALKGGLYEGENLHSLNPYQLKKLGADEIERAIATYLSQTGFIEEAVFDSNGQLTSYAQEMVSQQIRNDNVLSGAYSGNSYTVAEALGLRTVGPDGVVNKRNVEILENFARALGTTTDELSSFGNNAKYAQLTLGDLVASASDSVETIKKLHTAISDLSNSSTSMYEKQLKIIKEYPEYIGQISDMASVMKSMWQRSQGLIDLQNQKMTEEVLSSEQYYNDYILTAINSNSSLSASLKGDALYEKQSTIKGLMTYISSLDPESEIGAQLTDIINNSLSQITITNDLQRDAVKTVVEYQTHLLDQQLDNLKKQKEQLAEINKQREYSNKLIEAQLALENAMNQKSRVWREGVGWVYEANQEAIGEAQKTIENLNIEVEQANLETQMAEIEAEKAELQQISENEKWEEQRQYYESFIETISEETGVSVEAMDSNTGTLATILNDVYTGIETMVSDDKVVGALDGVKQTMSKYFEEILKASTADATAAQEKVISDYQELQKYEEKMKTAHGANWRNSMTEKEKGQYNSLLSNFQSSYNSAKDAGYIKDSDFKAGADSQFAKKMQEAKIGNNGQALLNAVTNSQSVDYKDIFYVPAGGGKFDKLVSGGNLDALSDSKYNDLWYSMSDTDTPGSDGGNQSDAVIYSPDQPQGVIINKDSDGKNFNSAKEQWGSSGLNPQNSDSLTEYISKNPNLIIKDKRKNKVFYFKNGSAYQISETETGAGPSGASAQVYTAKRGEEAFSTNGWATIDQFASGTLGVGNNSPAIINELGTEAIITPQGTITSLPSATGVVPADITKNLWQLGELSPIIVQKILGGNMYGSDMLGVGGNGTSVDESLTINTVNMNVNADGSFDVDKFVYALKTQAALNKK